MISFEIRNALTRLKRRQILNGEEIIAACNVYKKVPLENIKGIKANMGIHFMQVILSTVLQNLQNLIFFCVLPCF
jgi:hypothetical protein